MNKVLLPVVTAGALAVAGTHSATAQQTCRAVDSETERVLPGVTLTYDSSFRCTNVPDEGSYQVTVMVANDSDSAQSVRLKSVVLGKTSPRPRGTAPSASAASAELPVRVAPGATATFDVSGSYELVTTDEGDKANLHLRVRGAAAEDGDRFRLGVNVHLRG